MPFCAKAVKYPACIPKAQSIPPSIDFPDGRWMNHTVLAKDTWVSENVNSFIRYREGLEKNKTMRNSGRNEFGDRGHVARRFYKRPDCRHSYHNYVCWINFPRCDVERDMSLPTCRSSCENFFKTCHYSHDLWRCGKSKFFNGYGPESPSVDQYGVVTYLREYFPGQPFRENKYDDRGNEEPICTPAITGSSFSIKGGYSVCTGIPYYCLVMLFLLLVFLF
jgi:hypothetical protein